jgi:succinate-semialdehyde dehydrogenase / glutarate-semialdehyde dehydrogenase
LFTTFFGYAIISPESSSFCPTPIEEEEYMTYQSVNPYDGAILQTFDEIGDKELEAALETASICFESWRNTTFAERATVATRAAALLRARVDEFARPVTLEMGKRIDEARGEVRLSADIIDYYAIAFEKLWRDAGAPEGAYTNLLISYDQVNRVIDDRRIKGVALTGGVDAARSVAGRAGQNLKKSTMELGGSDAFIVLEDADLDKTVAWAVWGKMNNTGQCCVAAKRFIVVEQLADRFLDKFQTALAALKPGDPMDEETTLGPLSSEAALDKLLVQVERAVVEGASVIMGGKRINRPGAFMQPTILTDIKPDHCAFRDEFFGPVALFFRVRDEDEAVVLANDSEFGLGGSVFTQDVARGQRVASRIDTGMVFVNHPTWTAPELPFGGIKNSGYGRELSSLGIHEFVNKKLVRVESIDAPA